MVWSDPISDSSDVNPLLVAPETGAVASAETARSLSTTPVRHPISARSAQEKKGRIKAIVMAAGGFALLAAGIVLGMVLAR